MEASPTRTVLTIALALAITLSGCRDDTELVGPAEPAQTGTLGPPIEAVDMAVRPGPDRRTDIIGGMAARMRSADGVSIPGDLFQVMAIQGSAKTVRVYDETPFVHDRGVHPVTAKALDAAAAVASRILGAPVAPVGMTTAAGGGDSAGLLYVLSYLQLATNGALANDVSLAATGALAGDGRLTMIAAADEKLAAAVAAGVDVVFTTTQPSAEAIESVAGRWVSVPRRVRTGDVAADRGWDEYRAWGSDRSSLDVVGVRHVGDVIAYLCGAGSSTACELVEEAALATSDDVSPTVAIAPMSAPSGVR